MRASDQTDTDRLHNYCTGGVRVWSLARTHDKYVKL